MVRQLLQLRVASVRFLSSIVARYGSLGARFLLQQFSRVDDLKSALLGQLRALTGSRDNSVADDSSIIPHDSFSPREYIHTIVSCCGFL